MFDVGFSELVLIGVVALVVLGPERLPGAARTAGTILRRARASWASVKAEVEREVAAEELRRSLREGAAAADVRADLQATANEVRSEIQAAADDAAKAGDEPRPT
jgi:sec-independent protein translocase protein TatB